MVQGSSDIGAQVVRLMIHLVQMIHDAGRKDLLESYIKVSFHLSFYLHTMCILKLSYYPILQYVFMCVGNGIHEHLMAPLYTFVDTNPKDFLLSNKFMQHSNFFFEIITKSMAQYLINTGRIKVKF